jgi:PTH1 family peptidyl-tRNA hydrolase
MKDPIKLIVGLGNPGPAYKHTRHNAGASAVERWAKELGLPLKSHRTLKSLLAQGKREGRVFFLVLPQTYMNLSGEAVAGLARKKHIAPQDILVVYDDVALPLGTLRVRPCGGAGGHHGLVSIIENLGTKDFARLRLGIAGQRRDDDLAAYVLSRFDKDEEGTVKEMTQRAVQAIDMWMGQGVELTMGRFNSKDRNKSLVQKGQDLPHST